MFRYLLLLVALLSFGQSNAQTTDQNYPVTAQAFVVAQPNQKLAAYFASNKALTVSLLLKDLTKTSILVYLRWSIDGPGVHLSSMDGHIPAHFITLQRGMMQRLSGLDLQSDYFLSNLILAEGLAGPPLRTSLPEGFYTFRVQALEAGTGREVSNWGETYFSITTPLPPVINIPFNGAELLPTEAQKNGVQPITIQWMPRHYRLPGSITSYDLKVCKVPDGYEPTEALEACVSPIIDDKGNPGTFYPGNTGIGNSIIGAFEIGAKYAARVTIHEFDANGDEILFANEGRSEVTWFRFGKQCISPASFTIKEVGPGRLQLTWNQLDGVDSYTILYRKTGELQWKTTTTASPSTVLSGLAIGTYEISVQSGCSVEMPSSIQIYTIGQEEQPKSPTTNNPFLTRITSSGGGNRIPDFFSDLLNPNHPDALKIPCSSQVSSYENCEAGHPVITPSGTIPLTGLQIGDVLTVYDMAVLVTGVNGSNPLSGTGLARLPFLQGIQGEVPLTPVEFSGVKAWKAENGTSGGCVYQVDGYFRSRSATNETLDKEQTAVLKALQPKADSLITNNGYFTGTLEEALITYDSLTNLIVGGNSSSEIQEELDAVKEAIVKATEEWKQQLITQYPDTAAGHTRAVAILTDLDSLNTRITDGSLVGAEKAYKDALNDFNHPAPTILPFTPDAPTLTGPSIARLGSCMQNGAGYDPLSTPGTDGVACLGELNETPYWSYTEGNQTWYLIAQANPDGSYTYARASETDWVTCGRSPIATCATTWQTVRLPEGENDNNANPLLPSITQVIASPVGSQTATINWQGGPAFARYIVKYKGPGGAEQQETVTSTKINLVRLTENSNYSFTIEGYDAAGTLLDTYSNGAFSTTTERLAMPKNVLATVQNDSTVVLTWDKDVSHLSYKLVYDDGNGHPRTAFPTANASGNNSFTISGLDSTLTYTFTLVAVGKNSSGGELLSDPAQGSFTTKAAEPCSQPLTVSTAINPDYKGFKLTWTPVSGQTGTIIRYRKVQNPEAFWTTTIPETSELIINNLISGSQYEYKAMPLCGSDSSKSEAGGFVFLSKDKVKPTVAYQCGANKRNSDINRTPLDVPLQVGDYILIGDFPAQIDVLDTKVAPYKGLAHVLVPYLGLSTFLMEFTGLQVNIDNEVIAGEMHSITNPDVLAAVKKQNAERIEKQKEAVRQVLAAAKELIQEIGQRLSKGDSIPKNTYDSYVQKQNEIITELNGTDPELAAEIKEKMDELMAIYTKPEYLIASTNDYKPKLSEADQAKVEELAEGLVALNDQANTTLASPETPPSGDKDDSSINEQVVTKALLYEIRFNCGRYNGNQSATSKDGEYFTICKSNENRYYFYKDDDFWKANGEFYWEDGYRSGIFRKYSNGKYVIIELPEGQYAYELLADELTYLFFVKTPLLLLSGGTSGTLTEFAVDQISGILLDQLQAEGAINMETNMLASVIIGMVGSRTFDADQLNKLIEDVKRLSKKAKPEDLKRLIAEIVEKWKTAAKKEVNKAGNLLDNTLIAELKAAGMNFTEADLKFVTRNNDNLITFLEKGNKSSGLQHIIDGKWTDKPSFQALFNNSIDEMITNMFKAIKESNYVDKIIDSQNRLSYVYKVQTTQGLKEFKIATGTNGYIVSFIPNWP